MSAATIQAREWALDQNLPCTPKMVLVILGDMANSKPDHTCWPSMEKLAAKCGLAVRTVRDAIKDLIRSKFLRVLGLHEWGTPLYQLAVGETLKWIGRLRGSHQAKQGRLFPAPGRTEPVRHLPPNPESELTREREPRIPVEHITKNGMTFTVTQWRILERRRGTELSEILEDMQGYRESGGYIRSPYGAALNWKVAGIQPSVTRSRREPAQMHVQTDIEDFTSYLCMSCDSPHEWKTDDTFYCATSIKRRPCPELRKDLKCVEAL